MSDKVFPTDKPAKVSTNSRPNKYFLSINLYIYEFFLRFLIKVFRPVCNGKYGNGELNITY